MELSVTNRNLQFVDDPLFQESNEIVARFGYVNDPSPRKKAVIKDIDYGKRDKRNEPPFHHQRECAPIGIPSIDGPQVRSLACPLVGRCHPLETRKSRIVPDNLPRPTAQGCIYCTFSSCPCWPWQVPTFRE